MLSRLFCNSVCLTLCVQVKSHSKGSSNKPDAENIALAKAADVTIIFCGASTGESADRQSLSLDADCDAFISAVAKVSKKVAVLVMTPGAFLTPWREEVSTVATMFLGGQETGAAWADIVFGDVSPAGRLPIELPATEADTIEPNPAPSFAYTGEKPVFLSHLYRKIIILPRQARHKHRESTQKTDRPHRGADDLLPQHHGETRVSLWARPHLLSI